MSFTVRWLQRWTAAALINAGNPHEGFQDGIHLDDKEDVMMTNLSYHE